MQSIPHSLLSYLRVVVGAWRDDPRDNAQLLAQFAEGSDEAAFRVLVCRHGPLVWQTCQRILGDTPDAEDAFQTAFLALACKASQLRGDTLAGWLHRVARQTALNAEANARRRRGLEQRLRAVRRPAAEEEASRAELYAVLDEELAGLPERLRVPLVLRYLEGKTLAEVAQILGCSLTLVTKRLARGETILRQRLTGHGLGVGIVSVGVLLGSTVTASAVPARLIGSTARAAVAFRSGTLTGGAAEAARAVLGALPSSVETTIMWKSLWLVLACVCSLGVSLAVWQASLPPSEAVELPESAASPQKAAEPSGGQVDRFGDSLPTGALARLGTVRLRHSGTALQPEQNEANSVMFSRDGKLLITAGLANPIRVWDAATGKLLRSFGDRNQDVVVLSLVLSPDGRTLAARHKNGQDVSFWEIATGKRLPPMTVHWWEAATGKQVEKVRKWPPDETETRSVFSPDGKIVATGSSFGPIRLWEAATGKELRRCQGYRAHVVALAFSPDGGTLASLAGLHDHTARLWDVASGKERLRTSRGHVGPVVSVAFSADGKSVISGGRDGLVGFWDAETGQEQRPPLRIGDFQALAALAPDGKTFLTVSNSYSPNVFPDPQTVALETPSVVCVWDRATGQKLREFKGFVGAPQSLTLSPDGKFLLWNSWNRVYLIEVATGKTIHRFPDTFEPKCAAFSPDGKTLAVYLSEEGTAGGKATVHFHETATGKELGFIQAHQTLPWCLTFSPDGQTFVLGGMADGHVIVQKGNKKYEENAYPIRLWRAQWGKKDWKEAVKLVGHRDEIWGLTFSPDGRTLASASRDGTLRLWEMTTGQERRCFAGHGGNVWCLAFAPDGRRLAAGGDDTAILVWDLTGRLHSGQQPPVKLSPQEVKNLWADLAGVDAVRAGQAVWTLAAAPAQALPLFREHLRPVAPVGKRIVRLIADLDSDTFAVRQKAADELEELGEVAEPALRQAALAKSASLEMGRRLEQLLERVKEESRLHSGNKVRSLRAVEVLGQIGTPEALPLLEALARGEPGARQTLEAQAVLKLLRTRVKEAAKP